jgi:hypothetical protein
MWMHASTVRCPVCDKPATLTMFGAGGPANTSNERTFTFRCVNRRHMLAEPEMLDLWAVGQSR